METVVSQPVMGQERPNRNPSQWSRASPAEYMAAILQSLQTMKNGDFSVRLPVSWTGLPGKIADNFNEIVTANEQMASELKRVGQAVGKEGKTRERIRVEQRRGAWDDMEVSVNTLVEDLLRPTTEVTHAIAAVAQGNLTQTVRLDVDGRPLEGEFLRSANIVNTMIQQLGVFTAEVTRVAREVGTDGKLGGQAVVPGVAGTWKDLTDSVNSMASNLTGQVRNIAEVATAVASGDLSRKITVDVRGEILQLKEAINTMVDQLRSFASEVTRVAREVGTDGKLGGQAVVPGVAGTWKDLTDSVNAMAGNLTAQVRNIAEVTTAVARGDLVAQDHGRREGRNSGAERHHQHHGGSAQRVRRRSDARGPRSGHRRQAGRPGQRARRGRNLEGSDRQRELHGRQPDRPGAQHRRSGNGHRQRRSFAQDHGGRARRNSAAQRNAEHHGGPAEPVRRRSDARGSRSGNRRPAGRTGQRARRGRNVEGSYRLSEFDGRQPDGAGEKHRRSDHGRGPRRSCRARSRST